MRTQGASDVCFPYSAVQPPARVPVDPSSQATPLPSWVVGIIVGGCPISPEHRDPSGRSLEDAPVLDLPVFSSGLVLPIPDVTTAVPVPGDNTGVSGSDLGHSPPPVVSTCPTLMPLPWICVRMTF